MRRVFAVPLCLLLLAGLVGCGQSAPSAAWQEQYDLGVKYLEDGSYDEAVLAFTAAIEIDPKQPDAYQKLAETYTAQGDLSGAKKALEDGLSATDDAKLREDLERTEARLALVEDCKPLVDALEISFAAGGMTLGESSIAQAKAAYGEMPYALSNLMNDDTEDTVYTCYGMNGTPIPQGHGKGEFGFLFVEPVSGGGISHIAINDSGISCLGALECGDDMAAALELFGLTDIRDQLPGWVFLCETESGRELRVALGESGTGGSIRFRDGNRQVIINFGDGKIDGVSLELIADGET